jgi:BirA family biotin operon repressor/biotin-[acetyl-CoA-carboxylase] ligase
MSDPVPFEIADALERSTRRRPFGDSIYYFTETGSTNDDAAALAERGAPEGTTVLSSAQRAGRGRLGREWHSPRDAGLYVSLVCRNQRAAPFLTLAGGAAVAEGIRAATGLPVEIKWPNDVMTSGGARRQRRKLAGVLAEAASEAGRFRYVVIGLGINLRPFAYPREIADRASDLETELGRSVDAARVLVDILEAFSSHYHALAEGHADRVLASWRSLAPSASGASVECDTGRGRTPGVTAGIAEDGALLVRTGERTERIVAGEVVWK